jgi:hypothetical protein
LARFETVASTFRNEDIRIQGWEERAFASYAPQLEIAIAGGQAKPLMSVRWPSGAKEGEALAFDSKRLK